MKRDLFKDKTLLITGGTGSFGNKVLDRFLKDDIELKEIRIFSRDEKKQEDMRISQFKPSKLIFLARRTSLRLQSITKLSMS